MGSKFFSHTEKQQHWYRMDYPQSTQLAEEVRGRECGLSQLAPQQQLFGVDLPRQRHSWNSWNRKECTLPLFARRSRERECIVLLLVLQKQVLLMMWIVLASRILPACIVATAEEWIVLSWPAAGGSRLFFLDQKLGGADCYFLTSSWGEQTVFSWPAAGGSECFCIPCSSSCRMSGSLLHACNTAVWQQQLQGVYCSSLLYSSSRVVKVDQQMWLNLYTTRNKIHTKTQMNILSWEFY